MGKHDGGVYWPWSSCLPITIQPFSPRNKYKNSPDKDLGRIWDHLKGMIGFEIHTINGLMWDRYSFLPLPCRSRLTQFAIKAAAIYNRMCDRQSLSYCKLSLPVEHLRINLDKFLLIFAFCAFYILVVFIPILYLDYFKISFLLNRLKLWIKYFFSFSTDRYMWNTKDTLKGVL